MTVSKPGVAPLEAGTRPELAAPLAGSAETTVLDRFVGRVIDLDELIAIVDAARNGSGRLVLISGEPGIGKTRLAEETARYAAAEGVRVVWATSWRGAGVPPFWPWVQVLRACVDDLDTATRQAEVGTAADAVWRLLSDGREQAGIAARPSADGEQDRFHLFDAVTTLLRATSRRHPLLVILDDLQWADTPSLLLLSFAAGHLHRSRIAVVGVFRDTDVDASHPLARLLEELPSTCTPMALRGLQERDVAALIEGVLGSAAASGLAGALERRTGGNPLFLRELLRVLARRRDAGRVRGESLEDALPDSVRQAVLSRVARLPRASQQALTAAAVVGRAFATSVLAVVVGDAEEQAAQLVAPAAHAGLIIEVGPGEWRFVHDVVRETLYDGLDAAQRQSWHHAAGVALDAQGGGGGGDRGAHLAEVAHHFVHGLPTDVARAADYSARAGEHALAQLAYEAAVDHFRRALALVHPASPDQLRLSALLGLAEAQRRVGDADAARAGFEAAADVARRVGDGAGLAQAALGYGALWGEWSTSERGSGNRRLVALLDEALEQLGPDDSVLRVRVLARQARTRYFGQAIHEADALSLAAVQAARRLGHPRTLAEALAARVDALWVPGDPTVRLAVAADLLAAARDSRDDELALQAHAVRFTAHLEQGDALSADAELDAYEGLADTLNQPRYRWYAASRRAVRAIMAGRFDEGERLARHALVLGQQAGEPEAEPVFWDARRTLGRHRGFNEEDLAAQRRYAHRYPDLPIFRMSAAHVAAEMGRPDEAAALLDGVLKTVDELSRDWLWCPTVCLLAETAARLDDRPLAARLLQVLRPYADFHAVESGATAYGGSVAHILGLLAACLDRLDDAVAHLSRALAMHVGIGARPWRAHTDYELARVLLRRGDAGDDSRARDLLAGAAAVADELGMPLLAERVADASAGGAPPLAATRHVFHREGDVWTLAYGGHAVRLSHLKGLADLHRLVAHPGREFHVLELAAERPPARSTGSAEPGLSAAGDHRDPVLDEQAVAAYRARLMELEDEIADAEGANDLERASSARQEQQLIAGELAAALGLRGRARSFPDAGERARKAVGNRIRSALSRIEQHHPRLARHLRSSVQLGVFCSYRPADPVRWRL